MAKRAWWLAGAGLAALAAFLTRWPAVNDVTTGQSPEYADLKPRQYPRDAQTVFRAAQKVAEGTRGWHITAADPDAGELHAEARVLLTPFTDDVTVWVQPSEGGSRVTVRSHSRVGRGDLGVNARRIRTFLHALDRQLDESLRGDRAKAE
jgi:uncharacterized protein (DUF1499 family)